VAVVLPLLHSVPDAVALPDFTDGVAVEDTVVQPLAESGTEAEGEVVAVGQLLGVYEKDAVLLVVPEPRALEDAVAEPLLLGELLGVGEPEPLAAAENEADMVPDALTVEVGEYE
jgi:hypothetical protein